MLLRIEKSSLSSALHAIDIEEDPFTVYRMMKEWMVPQAVAQRLRLNVIQDERDKRSHP